MLKLKLKSTGTKANNEHSYAKHEPTIVSKEQPEVKEKKVKTPPRKVVYITKRGSKAVFDSVALCAKIFDVDESTIRFKIEHPVPKRKATLKGGDWLKGGHLEYINN